MTNEEMAISIQNGDESKVPELWERVRKLYMSKSLHYYGSHRTLCARCGVELEDIQQQSFFAFLRTVEEYQPESGKGFLSFVNYPFMTEMQNLTGTRTALTRLDPLNSCASLDKEIENEDGTGDTLGDFVPDPTALEFLELLDRQSVGAMIRAEVRKLPAPVCEVIDGYFLEGKTLEKLGQVLGVSLERVRQLKNRGLNTLSKRRVLVDLWNETNHTAELRKLERTAEHERPDEYEAGRRYARTAQPKPKTCIDLAAEYAARKREQLGKSLEDWTRDDQLAAMLEYLHGGQATA